MIKQESFKKGSLITAILNIIARLVGFATVFVIASKFGASGKTDVYYFLLSTIGLFSAIVTSFHSTVFLPLFIKIRNQKNIIEAWNFFNSLFTYSLVFSLFFGLLLLLFGTNLMGSISQFDNQIISSSSIIIACFSPILTCMILLELLRTILFANNQFSSTSFSLLINSILTLILILFFAKIIGVEILAYSVLLSYLIQVIYLLFYLRKYEPNFSLRFKIHSSFKELFFLGLPIFISQIFASFSMFYFDYSATYFAAGTVTAISYGNRLSTLTNDMLITPISNTVATLFSDNATKENNTSELKRNFYRILILIWIVVIPISMFLFFFSLPIIQTLFERGQFHKNDSEVASTSLMFFSISIFGYALNSIGTRVFLALQKTYWLSLSAIIISIFSVILTKFLVNNLGYVGIPIARSLIVSVLSVLTIVILSYNYLADFNYKDLLIPFCKITICSAIAFLIPFLIYLYIKTVDYFDLHFIKILFLGATLFFSSFIYIILLNFFKVYEIKQVFNLIIIRYPKIEFIFNFIKIK